MAIVLTCCVALDEFGAAVLGRLNYLAHELDGREAMRHCLQFWGGRAARPGPDGYWSAQLEGWTCDDAKDEPAAGGMSSRGLEAIFRKIESDIGRARVERIQFVLLGHLASPQLAEDVVGWLGHQHLRRAEGAEVMLTRDYCILGAGVDPRDPPPIPHTEARARSAEGILRLQEHVEGQLEPADPCAIYVVTDQVLSDHSLDSESLIWTAALLLHVLTQDAAAKSRLGDESGFSAPEGLAAVGRRGGHDAVPSEPDLFDLEPRAMEAARWGPAGAAWDRQRPFAIPRLAALLHPAKNLHRVLALRFMDHVMCTFAAADPDDAADPEGWSDDAALLRRLDEIMVSHTRTEVGRRKLPVDTVHAVWDHGTVATLVGHIMRDQWPRVTAFFGKERLTRLPLEDWEEAIEDLLAFIDQGVLRRRRAALKDFGVQLLAIFDGCLEKAFNHVGLEPWRAPCHFAPRRACRALVCELRRRVEESLTAAKREWLVAPHHDSQEIEYLKKQANENKQALLGMLKDIPSPLAVWLRVGMITCAATLVMLALPFSLGPLDGPLLRAAGGLLAAGLATWGILARAQRARRFLLEQYDRWVESYQRAQDAQDEHLAHEAVTAALQLQLDYCTWMLDREGEEPFTPRTPGGYERAEGESPQGEGTIASTRKEFLRSFSVAMDRAQQRVRACLESTRRCLRDAQAVKAVPPPTELVDGFLDGLLRDAGLLGEGEGPARVVHGLETIAAWEIQEHASGHDHELSWLPFTPRNGQNRWALACEMPPDESLLDPVARRASEAFALLSMVERYLAGYQITTLAGCLQRLGLDHQVLREWLNKASDGVAHVVGAGSPVSLLLRHEGVAGVLNTATAAIRDLGPNVEGVCSLTYRLSGRDIVLGPDPNTPTTFMGRAWKAAQGDGQRNSGKGQ